MQKVLMMHYVVSQPCRYLDTRVNCRSKKMSWLQFSRIQMLIVNDESGLWGAPILIFVKT